VFLGVLCFSTLAIAAPIRVELEVATVGEVDTLKVKNNEEPCDSGPTNSDCIEVGLGRSPYIVFKLPDACDKDEDDAYIVKYKLASMRITLIEKVWPTVGSPLNALVATDLTADPYTGEIDFTVGNNNQQKKKLKFKNRNTHAYTVFYEITAEHCDSSLDADDIHLDPQIRNKGDD